MGMEKRVSFEFKDTVELLRDHLFRKCILQEIGKKMNYLLHIFIIEHNLTSNTFIHFFPILLFLIFINKSRYLFCLLDNLRMLFSKNVF